MYKYFKVSVWIIICFFYLNSLTVSVAEEKKVEYEGEVMSLTRLTRKLKELDYDIQPGPHWFYKGKSLKEIYDETYETL